MGAVCLTSRYPAWLEGAELPCPAHQGDSLLLVGCDGTQVTLSASVLLAVSPVVRAAARQTPGLLLQPVPAVTVECGVRALQAVRDLLAGRAVAGLDRQDHQQVHQLLQALQVAANIESEDNRGVKFSRAGDSGLKVENVMVKLEVQDEDLDFINDNTGNDIRLRKKKKKKRSASNDVDADEDFDPVRYPCNYCEDKFSRVFALRKHMKSEHPSENHEKRHQCQQCDYRALSRCTLVKHVQSKHEGVKHKCEICGRNFTQTSHLKVHQRNKHPDLVGNEGGVYSATVKLDPDCPFGDKQSRTYPCEKCDLVFSKQHQLHYHNQTKHEHSTFLCSFCDYRAQTKSALSKHIQSIHEGVKYPCDLCGKQYRQQGALKQHMQTVHEGMRFHCDQCDYKFTKEQNLRRHVQSVHEGLKHSCNMCAYSTTNKHKLKKHILAVHEGVKQHCDQCDSEFMNRFALKKHIMSIHENIRFRCTQCDYQAIQASNLKVHMETKHECRPHFCEKCGHLASSKSGLNKHTREMHEGTGVTEAGAGNNNQPDPAVQLVGPVRPWPPHWPSGPWTSWATGPPHPNSHQA